MLTRREGVVTAREIIFWWERRRIIFNLVVGTTGTVTVAVLLASAVVTDIYLGEPIGFPDPPLFAVVGVVAFAIAANVLYTGGWITELCLEHILRKRPAKFARTALLAGLTFSVAITLMPGVLVAAIAIAQLVALAIFPKA